MNPAVPVPAADPLQAGCLVEQDRPVQEVLELLLGLRVHHAVVTCEGRPVGVVTCFDLLRVLQERLRAEVESPALEVSGCDGDLSDEWA